MKQTQIRPQKAPLDLPSLVHLCSLFLLLGGRGGAASGGQAHEDLEVVL